MLTVITSNKTTNDQTTMNANTTDSSKGAELLLSFMLWEQKFEQDAHEIFEDPIEVFLTAQGEKTLSLA
jgi:hypothetical protein